MLRIALPTGDLRAPVAATLAAAGLACDEYGAGSRALRLSLSGRDDVALRVFREKDIPIQVALGHYDLGICAGAWVRELEARFPQEDVTLLRPLAFGGQRLVLACAPGWAGPSSAPVRIVSEYPGLAERFARQMRFSRYVVFPVWGAADAYPPEDADLALVAAASERAVAEMGLEPLTTVLDAPAWLIGNRRSLATRDLSAVIGRLLALEAGPRVESNNAHSPMAARLLSRTGGAPTPRDRSVLRLAIPDGHAQRHTYAALAEAGLSFDGYQEKTFVRRPHSGIDGLKIKVIRPQDMPQQVALGNFDLAVTGRDWLLDHHFAFPNSPVAEAVDLRRSVYGITAAVSEDVPGSTLAEAMAHWRATGVRSIRVAAEYPNIADHYGRDRRLGRYQVVPVNGASEAFVPEDSEILIEGTETGSSFRANRLKGIDHIFESTNCLITGTAALEPAPRALRDRLINQLKEGVLSAGR